MQKLKFVFISAATGFILSLFFGIFSHAHFFIIFLRALITAIVFAGLAFLIQFIYSKFLKIEGDESFSVSSQPSSSANASSSVGGKVNLVISDSELEQSGSVNHYVVGSNRQMLNDTDVIGSKSESVQTEEEKKLRESFTPVQKTETSQNVSEKESITPSQLNNEQKSSNKPSFQSVSPEKLTQSENKVVESDDENKNKETSASTSSGNNEIDVLPDMGGFDFSESTNESSEVDTDSDTGTSFSSSALGGSYGKKESPEVDVKDASLIAKAISSILSEES